MREIGTIADEREAEVFKAHLYARKISSKIVASKAGCAIWILDENLLATAKEELSAFLADPSDAKYRESGRVAKDLEKVATSTEKRFRKNVREIRELWEGPAWRRYPLTLILIAASVGVGLTTDFGNDQHSATFRAVILTRDQARPGQAAADVDVGIWSAAGVLGRGEVWRLVTPIFLHFGGIHLLFNMLCLRSFGGLIEVRKGSLRLFLLVLVSAVASNMGQFLADSQSPEPSVFGGMSGVCYALFGYLMAKGYSRPQDGLGVNSNTVVLMLGWFLLCALGVNGPIANTAHGVGLIVGIIAGVTRF